eukprot:s1851_g18.t1
MPDEGRPTVSAQHEAMRTEGKLPGASATGLGSTADGDKVDDLQRALEVEMVDFLRGQNSKLADEVWLEREVRSSKFALDRVAVPPLLQQSGYWNAGFDRIPSNPHALSATAACAAPASDSRCLHGDDRLQARAQHGSCDDQRLLGRASQHELGGYQDCSRALHAFEHGGDHDRSRALHLQELAGHFDQVRASTGHGEHREQDRAPGMHGDLPGHGRALGMDVGANGLCDKGPLDFCQLPRPGVGGGGVGDDMRPSHWPENAVTTMNTKGELPDLPANSSPLQFGDWLHLIAPSMKDISGVAGWWWENTLREAHCYYSQWKESSPLQRIRIRPVLPDALMEHKFQRTEQRGIQMLLKAIPETEQQALVTERALSTTAILYRLLDLASNLRNWRRHFGRAQEVQAVLPDGILLLKALDGPLQHLASLDPQAAFRLAQSRMQLQLDERPVHSNLWAFSQCLLAEAETLCLLATSTTSTVQSPLKLKPMDAMNVTTPKKPLMDNGVTNATADTPCKWFRSDAGCRAGKNCKWSHSWEGIDNKNARCWICGSAQHRKNDCKVKGGGKKFDESKDSGGGGPGPANATKSSSAASSSLTSSSATAPQPKVNEMNAMSSTTSPSDAKATSEAGDCGKKANDAGTGGEAVKSEKSSASDLLHEATQLLKTLQVRPKLHVMQINSLEQAEPDRTLVDSGATHGLRAATDISEWDAAEATVVQLASGSTEDFRLKRGTRTLLAHPSGSTPLIVPMSALDDLDYKLEWSSGTCRIYDDEGRTLTVTVVNGCPMIPQDEGRQLLQWWEHYQMYQRKKLAVIKTMLLGDDVVDRTNMTLDVAVTLKLKHVFPDLPDHVMAKLVPYLGMVNSETFGAKLPWNRRKRRRLDRAKHVVVHLFSGRDHKFWEQQRASADTEVLCVDLEGSISASLHDKNIFAYLLTLCASGRVKSILAGPPCRTVSALRYQQDDGPGILRCDQHPYGRPDLSVSDAELVLGDVILWYRMLALYIVAEEVRTPEQLPTQLVVEQREDPARYRDAQDVAKNQYFSNFRTIEWKNFAAKYGVQLYHCDQYPMGHAKRKPTTLASTSVEFGQLDGIRGGPPDEATAAAKFRSLPMEDRFKVSKSWAMAIAAAVRFHLKESEGLHASLRPRAEGPEHQVPFSVPPSEHSSMQPQTAESDPNEIEVDGQHASLRPLIEGQETLEHFSVQSLRPDSLQQPNDDDITIPRDLKYSLRSDITFQSFETRF